MRNKGTLITSPIRPYNTTDKIAVAYSSELKGGFHSVETLDIRDKIIPQRREWGMLVTITKLKKTYQLMKPSNYEESKDTEMKMDNKNWEEFQSGTLILNSNSWLDIVDEIILDEKLLNNSKYKINTKRYLILDKNSNNYNNILTWNINDWNIEYPTESQTVNVITEPRFNFKFHNGQWSKYALGANPIKTIIDNEVILIPKYQQYLVYGDVFIRNNGKIICEDSKSEMVIINGNLYVEDESNIKISLNEDKGSDLIGGRLILINFQTNINNQVNKITYKFDEIINNDSESINISNTSGSMPGITVYIGSILSNHLFEISVNAFVDKPSNENMFKISIKNISGKIVENVKLVTY